MDKRVFLAVALCAGIFLLWENLYYKPYLDKRQAWVQQSAPQHTEGSEGAVTPPPAPSEPGAVTTPSLAKSQPSGVQAPRTIALGDSGYGVSISTVGGTVSDVDLSEYRGQKTDHVRRLIGGPGQLDLAATSQELSYLGGVRYSVEKQDASHLVLAYDDANLSVRRNYTLVRDFFSLDDDIAITFKKQAPNYVYVGLRTIKTLPKSELENERRQIFLNHSGGQKTFQVADIEEVKEDLAAGNWFGFSSRYFLNAISNRSTSLQPRFQTRPADAETVAAGFFYPVTGKSITIPVRMYYGPKDTEILREAGSHLESAVDFGWFKIFAYPMLTVLKWLYKNIPGHNFGIAIILLTVMVKAATYPLTLKSMKSMKQMQRIQPQLARLRERYKDDKEKLNKEMLQLMRSNGYNPMSGCLPMFIQMPIFIALYNVLYGAIDLYGQPFFGWIHDLSAKDPFYVTPVLLALMMFVQQKMTPNTAADPAQQKMMMMMPVVFGFMMLWLPSGLTLYMLVNSITSVAQQAIINRTINTGTPVPA